MKRSLFILSCLLLALSLLGLAAVLRQHNLLTFGAVNGLPDPTLDPRPVGLGINVALEKYPGPDDPFGPLAPFQWLRQTFPWDEIEPARGEYDWTRWDEIVSRGTSRQRELIAVLDFSPAWAQSIDTGVQLNAPTSRSGPPASPDDFAAFASAFAARYADRIDYYQIWDEPNILSGWGGQQPSAARYAALLQKAYTAIHAADPTATVIAAGLAPNVESGPDNYSELLYLQQLYDLGADQYFDAAAGKPYGYYTGPDDRLVDPAVINFSRFTLLRQVMEKNGDSHKLLWASNFGWNTHPQSAWGVATPEQQRDYTLAALTRAYSEWPWAGPLILENYQPDLPADDPHWGFALADPNDRLSLLGNALREFPLGSLAVSPPGNYPALNASANYIGDWEFSELGADIPQDYANARVEFTFHGTDLALRVRRGDYRAYLYVTVAGRPANLLPRDGRGAYLVLTSPELTPQVSTISVASGLGDGPHTAVIVPERGWDQWALAGFSVGRRVPNPAYALSMIGLMLAGFVGLCGVWRFGRGLSGGALGDAARRTWQALGDLGQLALTLVVGAGLYLSAWLTWGDELALASRRFGDAAPIVVTALTAGLFYWSPSFLGVIAAAILLFILFYLRPDLALAFAALFAPFYLQPRLLWQRGLSLVEITTLMALGVWALRNIRPALEWLKGQAARSKARGSKPIAHSSFVIHDLSFLDYAVLAFTLVATLSLGVAELKDFALREYRLAIVEPILFYFLIRFSSLDRRAVWRIVDFFMLGAVIVAGIGLYQYLTHTNLITAEGGVERIRSVYGSPNNLALYLGRALPIGLAVLAMGAGQWRRALYGLAALVIGVTIGLTFSKGALLFGVPGAVAVILILWLGRWGWGTVAVGAVAALATLPFLNRIPRFAGLLNPEGGTSFFRIKLWVSAWRMFLDHPLLGVGLDNFLYQYRSRYILPEAWQEPNLSHPHNIVFDYLSRLGLFGFAAGLWLQIAFWRTAVETYHLLTRRPERRAKPAVEGRAPSTTPLRGSAQGAHSMTDQRDLLALTVGLMASMADMLAHGLVDNSYFLVDLAFAFCLTLALIQKLRSFAETGPDASVS